MKIYVFGDSYSVDYDHMCLKLYEKLNYPDWKGYVPKKYYHLLCEYFNCEEIINFSKCGIDNDLIFELFMDNFDKIKEDDIVIFGWTQIGRFSITNNHDISCTDLGRWTSSVSYAELPWVINATENRNTTIYLNRQLKLIDYINKSLKKNKVIHWTWRFDNSNPKADVKSILYETDGMVNDYHYSELAHYELYQNFINEFNKKQHIIYDMWKINEANNINLSILDK